MVKKLSFRFNTISKYFVEIKSLKTFCKNLVRIFNWPILNPEYKTLDVDSFMSTLYHLVCPFLSFINYIIDLYLHIINIPTILINSFLFYSLKL